MDLSTLTGAEVFHCFVYRAHVLLDNVSEPNTLEDATEGLHSAHPTVMMDAGIATGANVVYLKAQGLDLRAE